jgi:hypothetical protein
MQLQYLSISSSSMYCKRLLLVKKIHKNSKHRVTNNLETSTVKKLSISYRTKNKYGKLINNVPIYVLIKII